MMSKNILKELPVLVEQGVIKPEDADRIRQFYQGQPAVGFSRLITAFGILGALLIGLGIVLLVAHNWDELSRTVRTILAFTPLALGQAVALFSLWKKNHSRVWREASATFWALSIGACLSLISQIYQMEGELYSFLLMWLLLGGLIVYLMRSSMASLLFIAGATWFAATTGYDKSLFPLTYAYLPLMLWLGPRYRQLIFREPNSNFAAFHHWLFPLSGLLVLGAFGGEVSVLLVAAYFFFALTLVLVGDWSYFSQLPAGFNGYRALGAVVVLGMLVSLTFRSYWLDVQRWQPMALPLWQTRDFYLALVAFVLAAGEWARQIAARGWQINPLAHLIWIMTAAFLLSLIDEAIGYFLMNISGLSLGLLLTIQGSRKRSLGRVNLGLLLLAALIAVRFFDEQIPFVIKGLLFVALGVGFFFANTRLIRNLRPYDAQGHE